MILLRNLFTLSMMIMRNIYLFCSALVHLRRIPTAPLGHAEAVALLVGASADVLRHCCQECGRISRRHRFDRDVKKGLALGSTASDYPRTLRRRRSMGRRRPSRHHLRDFGGDEQHQAEQHLRDAGRAAPGNRSSSGPPPGESVACE